MLKIFRHLLGKDLAALPGVQELAQLEASLKLVAALRSALNGHAIAAITDPQEKITGVNDRQLFSGCRKVTMRRL